MKAQAVQIPLTNQEFLKAVSNSFHEFIDSGTSRSTAKLKPLHGAIASDIAAKLGNGFSVMAQGYGNDKESDIKGRYMDKKVDITILKGRKKVAGIAVKFVMQNYAQNSNNYFENMLGETANLRSYGIPYFQIFIILDKLPYYNKSKEIKRWETFTDHNVDKYLVLSQDNADVFFHTPNKSLIYVVHVPDCKDVTTNEEYLEFYRSKDFTVETSKNKYQAFGSAVILNNYEEFSNKVYHTIMAL